MKPRTGNTSSRSFYTFLKPGALAQIRYSKISAKSRFQDAQAQILLRQWIPNSGIESPELRPYAQNTMEGLPCFNRRIKNPRPRCLYRKKIIAVAPTFSQSH